MNTTLAATETTTEAFCDSCNDLTEVKKYTIEGYTLLLCDMCAN